MWQRYGKTALCGLMRPWQDKIEAYASCSLYHSGIVGPRLLHQAAHKGKAAEVERLVKEDEHNVNEVDATGSTPLHAAAFEGTETVAETLIRLGAAVDASANDGSRAIHRAQTMRNDNIVQLLKNADASTSYGRVIVPEHLDKVNVWYSQSICMKKYYQQRDVMNNLPFCLSVPRFTTFMRRTPSIHCHHYALLSKQKKKRSDGRSYQSKRCRRQCISHTKNRSMALHATTHLRAAVYM